MGYTIVSGNKLSSVTLRKNHAKVFIETYKFSQYLTFDFDKRHSSLDIHIQRSTFKRGRPLPNRRTCSRCATNVYKLDAYAGARGFDAELRQYASRVPSPCALTAVYKIPHH